MRNDVASEPVRVEVLEGGAVRRVVLAAPKGNVIDLAMSAALARAFAHVADEKEVRAVLLEGEGAHFSFGASVPEHLPPTTASLLHGFHGLIQTMLRTPVVWLAAVRGRCLGGGLELASACHRIFAEPGAQLGQPEIALGVFAPAASVLLHERIGPRHAADLCLTGRLVGGAEALAMGVVDELATDPSAAALAWARTHLLPRSASSLRYAVRALREGRAEATCARIDAVERLYLDGIASTKDADEGLRAFLEKRSPRWSHA